MRITNSGSYMTALCRRDWQAVDGGCAAKANKHAGQPGIQNTAQVDGTRTRWIIMPILVEG